MTLPRENRMAVLVKLGGLMRPVEEKTSVLSLRTMRFYSEDQPRDESGRWGEGGSGESKGSGRWKSGDSVKTYLEVTSGLRGDNPKLAFSGPEQIVLTLGKSFTPQPLPDEYSRGPQKECYKNTFQLVMENPELTYVEGFAVPDNVPIPLAHAWAVDVDGMVIDTTWPNPGKEYVGVAMSWEFVAETAIRTEVYGVFDMNRELYTNGFPSGAVDSPERASQKFYSEDQPRDESGRWGEGGAGSLAAGEVKDSDAVMYERVMANLSPETHQRIGEMRERIAAGESTLSQHTDSKGVLTEERAALHAQIVEGHFANAGPGGNPPQVIVMGGLPGSGKSSLLEGLDTQGFVHIDSDAVKAQFPEYEGWNAALLHEEADLVVQAVLGRAVDEGRNIVLDSTMKTGSTARAMVSMLEELGYSSRAIFASVPLETAMTRVVERFESGGRFVDPAYVVTHDEKNVATFTTLKGIVDSWSLYDTSGPIGMSTLIEEGTRQ